MFPVTTFALPSSMGSLQVRSVAEREEQEHAAFSDAVVDTAILVVDVEVDDSRQRADCSHSQMRENGEQPSGLEVSSLTE